MDFIQHWDEECEKMNKRIPFEFPDFSKNLQFLKTFQRTVQSCRVQRNYQHCQHYTCKALHICYILEFES